VRRDARDLPAVGKDFDRKVVRSNCSAACSGTSAPPDRAVCGLIGGLAFCADGAAGRGEASHAAASRNGAAFITISSLTRRSYQEGLCERQAKRMAGLMAARARLI
jgi:hypothetical protein